MSDNSPIRICVNKIKNRITFKITFKTGHYLELLTPETMKLFGSTKNKITNDGNGEKVPRLEITEAIFVHYIVVNNGYQSNSKVLYTFIPNKSFCKLLSISSKSFIFLKTFESSYIY